MRRPSDCDCKCGCQPTPKTLQAFDKETGEIWWSHWLDNPVLSSDGYIYGYAYEQDDSPEAMSCRIVNLAGTGTPVTLGAAATSAIRYKKRVRKIDQYGSIVGDATFFWYTGNGGYTETPFELPDQNGWIPDFMAATASGELLQIAGDYTLGTTLGDKLISWNDNDTTTTRRYTIVGAAIRDLASVPTGGCKMRFIAANDGTNASQTIDMTNMIGKTAAQLATDIEAFPHIVSATGTGGPYPFVNIDLEIEWAQSATHFTSVQRQSSTCRGVMTWLRDWDTGEITATLVQPTTPVSKATLWQLDESDNILGIGTNGAASIGSPAEVGIAVEKFTRSGASYSQLWRVRPTGSRPPIWGTGASSGDPYIIYTRPAIRNGTIIVGHYPGRGNDQSVGEHSEWHEIDASAGTLLSNGTQDNRRVGRPFFASDAKLVVSGWDSFIVTDGLYYQCDRPLINFVALMNTLSGPVADYYGAYGPWPNTCLGSGGFSAALATADETAIYSVQKIDPSLAGGWNNDTQTILMTDQHIRTMMTRSTIGGVSRVSADGYFGLASYYRIEHFFSSPVNTRWNDASGLTWRVAFFTDDNTLSSSSPTGYTDWLAFDAVLADVQTALDAILGTNDFGPNAYVQGIASGTGTEDFPETSEQPCPQMVWQRGIEFIFPANNPAFPVESPPVHYGLNDRAFVRYCRIQVKSTNVNEHFMPSWLVSRFDWDTGDKIWDVPFGPSIAGGASLGGNTGILLGTNYVVSGNRVNCGCLCTYRWTYTAETCFGSLGWVLVFSDCGTKTATPPATSGTFEGEIRKGTCS